MPMASLNASLLARKGHASPAARPRAAAADKKVQEMFPAKRPQLTSPYAAKPVAMVVAKAAAPAPVKTAGKARVKGAGNAEARARKTLRLDRAKNRQLRLLAAHLGVTQQALMEEAVSKLLKNEIAEGSCVCGVCIACSPKTQQ